MDINTFFKNKTIYIAPYNDITIKLSEKLKTSNSIIKGFIDNSKKGDLIFTKEDISEFDYILVCSPNYGKEIINNLSTSQKMIIYYFDNNFYFRKPYLKIFLNKLNRFKTYLLNRRYRIKYLKNKHASQRAFIIGNGPSLKVEDIEKIKSEITFAANKIWLLFNDTTWRPTYYSVVDRYVLEQNVKSINNVNCSVKFMPDFLLSEDRRIKKAIYFKTDLNKRNNFDLEDGIYTGPTVIYTLISFAIYMGIKKIYIIGLDHNFQIPDKYKDFKKGDDNVIISEGEINHFHKDYRKRGEKWSQPEVPELTKGFEEIRELAKAYRVEIYNASRYSELEVFEKVNLDDIL